MHPNAAATGVTIDCNEPRTPSKGANKRTQTKNCTKSLSIWTSFFLHIQISAEHSGTDGPAFLTKVVFEVKLLDVHDLSSVLHTRFQITRLMVRY